MTYGHLSLRHVWMQIKPDGVQRGLVGEIIKRFEQKGYYLRGLKYKNVEKELAEEHYVDLASKPFYGSLVEYIGRYVCSPQALPRAAEKLRGQKIENLGHILCRSSHGNRNVGRHLP